jgi:hypothetical protein
MVNTPASVEHNPSTELGALATATATVAGLIFVFVAAYFLIVGSLVLSALEATQDGGVPASREIAWHEAVQREQRRTFAYKGVLLASPVLASGYSGVSVLATLGPKPLAAPLRSADVLSMFMYIAFSLLISFPFAVLAFERQRSLHLGWQVPWAVFVFLFGPLGWVAYRVHRQWPAISKCEHCANPSPQHLSACTACGERFLPPPPTGTEIFA